MLEVLVCCNISITDHRTCSRIVSVGMFENYNSVLLATLLAVGMAFGLSGCATSENPPVAASDDPFEAQNRKVHAFNLQLDQEVIRPVSKVYVAVVPAEGQVVVSNFADNLSLPSMVVNNLLQGNMPGAGQNSLRFVVNSTLGLAGLFDPSSDFGLAEVSTDFGETLHVWNVAQGAYLELPALGPSSQRAAVGIVVDFITNPLGNIPNRHYQNYSRAAKVASVLGKRSQYGSTIDAVLYDSADSYAQSRLFYLQNRNFKLGGTDKTEYDDLYIDPYEDIYAE